MENKLQDNMELLVNKINRKLKMFLKTRNITYLEKANDVLCELREEYLGFRKD